MKHSAPEYLLSIDGPSAGSGLCHHDGVVTLISDNSTFLYQFDIATGESAKIPLINEPAEHMPKPEKPDFEALAYENGTFYVIGSGSTSNRNAMVTIDARSREIVTTSELILLYAAMRNHAQISVADFNIEGVIKSGTTWYFFQRGNGPARNNGIFTVHAPDTLRENFTVDYQEIALPEINGFVAGFTDAVLVDGIIWFVAAAERGASTYLDGQVAGSMIGMINVQSMTITDFAIISTERKFEGIALYNDGDHYEFLLCEDADSASGSTAIYKIRIEKS